MQNYKTGNHNIQLQHQSYMYNFDVDTSIYLIFDILIQLECVSIRYYCLMYHDTAIYRYIVASLIGTRDFPDMHAALRLRAYILGKPQVHARITTNIPLPCTNCVWRIAKQLVTALQKVLSAPFIFTLVNVRL